MCLPPLMILCKEEKDSSIQSLLEFNTLSISPSADGTYEGRFLLLNKGSNRVLVGSSNEAKERLEPMFVSFQKFEGNKWVDIQMGYSGAAVAEYSLEPGVPCEFTTSLFGFDEQNVPVRGRIGIDGVWSEPFVLDWALDKKNGRFRKARENRLQSVREALAGAGFSKDLLEGDDFSERLLGALMNETTSEQAKAASLEPFLGNLNVVPDVLSSGLIQFKFASKEADTDHEAYKGWLVINPGKFTSKWFQGHLSDSVKIAKRGEGVRMEFGDHLEPWSDQASMYINIIYDPVDTEKNVDIQSARIVFLRMLGSLREWFSE